MRMFAEVEALYCRHGFAVSRRCHQLLGDDAAAHEVFVRLLDNPSAALAGQTEITARLHGMATLGCLNRLCQAGSGPPAWQDLEQLAFAWRATAPQPQRAAVHASLVTNILQEPDSLTALVALYHSLDGLPQAEIATLVQHPRATVVHRLARFAHKMRQTA